IEIVDREIFDFEMKRAARPAACFDQVFDHLVLAIDGNGAAASESGHIDAVARAEEAEVNASVHHAFTVEARADTDVAHHIHRALLENASTDALNDVVLAPGFEDDGIDALEMQQLSEQQARGASADDTYLGL